MTSAQGEEDGRNVDISGPGGGSSTIEKALTSGAGSASARSSFRTVLETTEIGVDGPVRAQPVLRLDRASSTLSVRGAAAHRDGGYVQVGSGQGRFSLDFILERAAPVRIEMTLAAANDDDDDCSVADVQLRDRNGQLLRRVLRAGGDCPELPAGAVVAAGGAFEPVLPPGSYSLVAEADASVSADAGARSGSASLTVTVEPGEDCTRTGSAKAETLTGTPGDDVLCGMGGADTIRGLGGDDAIYGGAGPDDVDGGPGDDVIRALGGADVVRGGGGRDQIDGGLGPDRILGGLGNDRITGFGGADVIRGGDGDDELIGGDGDDDLRGEAGSDRLLGEAGADRLVGGTRKDVLDGGPGDDVVKALDGVRDVVRCGAGRRDRATVDGIDARTGCERVVGLR